MKGAPMSHSPQPLPRPNPAGTPRWHVARQNCGKEPTLDDLRLTATMWRLRHGWRPTERDGLAWAATWYGWPGWGACCLDKARRGVA